MKKTVGEKLPLEHYRALMEDAPICTIDVIFLNPERTKVLLAKRSNEPYKGHFYSFGGRLYKNEEFVDAATRIAKQETGLTISPSELTLAGVASDFGPNSIFPGVSYHAVDIYFVCNIGEDRAIILDAQHSEAKWLDVSDPTIHPNVRTRIADALRTL